ncbi:hypothetical protein WJX84_004778 [Apatococcus fuscideae]|uniref:DCD domain-containing protein n=1 Tax=Apatococcus fuscideae TaxID=2026836 RepID=A0AAW1SV64_9CHLO
MVTASNWSPLHQSDLKAVQLTVQVSNICDKQSEPGLERQVARKTVHFRFTSAAGPLRTESYRGGDCVIYVRQIIALRAQGPPDTLAAGGFLRQRRKSSVLSDGQKQVSARALWPVIRDIKPGTHLFLLNITSRELHGCFEAVTQPGYDKYPQAFGGSAKGSPFPAQVEVRRWLEAPPLHEREYRLLLTERVQAPGPMHCVYELAIPRVGPLEERFQASACRDLQLQAAGLLAELDGRSSWSEHSSIWHPDDGPMDTHQLTPRGPMLHPPDRGLDARGHYDRRPLDWHDLEDTGPRENHGMHGDMHPMDLPHDWHAEPPGFPLDQPSFDPDEQPFDDERLLTEGFKDWGHQASSFQKLPCQRGPLRLSPGMDAMPPVHALSPGSLLEPADSFQQHAAEPERLAVRVDADRPAERLQADMPLHSRFSRYRNAAALPKHPKLRVTVTRERPQLEPGQVVEEEAPTSSTSSLLMMPSACCWTKQLAESGLDIAEGYEQPAGSLDAQQNKPPMQGGGQTRIVSLHPPRARKDTKHDSSTSQSNCSTTLRLTGILSAVPAKVIFRAIQNAISQLKATAVCQPKLKGLANEQAIDFLFIRSSGSCKEAIINFQPASQAPAGSPLPDRLLARMHNQRLSKFMDSLAGSNTRYRTTRPLEVEKYETQGVDALAERFGPRSFSCRDPISSTNVKGGVPMFYGLKLSAKPSPAVLAVLRRPSCPPAWETSQPTLSNAPRKASPSRADSLRPAPSNSLPASHAANTPSSTTAAAKPAAASQQQPQPSSDAFKKPRINGGRTTSSQLQPAAASIVELPAARKRLEGVSAKLSKTAGPVPSDLAAGKSQASGEKRRGGQRKESDSSQLLGLQAHARRANSPLGKSVAIGQKRMERSGPVPDARTGRISPAVTKPSAPWQRPGPDALSGRRSPAVGRVGTPVQVAKRPAPDRLTSDALAAAQAQLEAQEAKVRALKAEAELKSLKAQVRALQAQQEAQAAAAEPASASYTSQPSSAVPSGSDAPLNAGPCPSSVLPTRQPCSIARPAATSQPDSRNSQLYAAANGRQRQPHLPDPERSSSEEKLAGQDTHSQAGNVACPSGELRALEDSKTSSEFGLVQSQEAGEAGMAARQSPTGRSPKAEAERLLASLAGTGYQPGNDVTPSSDQQLEVHSATGPHTGQAPRASLEGPSSFRGQKLSEQDQPQKYKQENSAAGSYQLLGAASIDSQAAIDITGRCKSAISG